MAGFVFALRDPRIGPQIPDVMGPPRGVGAAHRQIQVQMLNEVGDVAACPRRGQPGVAPLEGDHGLAHDVLGGQVGDAGWGPAVLGAVVGRGGGQRLTGPFQQGRLDLA
jgi:hypothetical protein